MCKLWIPIIGLIFPIEWILQGGQQVLKTIQLAREAVRKGLVFGFQSSLQPVTGPAGRGQWRSPRVIMLGRRGSADVGVGGGVRAEPGRLGRPRASVAGGPAQPLARQPCQRPTWQVSLSGHCSPLGSRDLFNLGRIHPIRSLSQFSLCPARCFPWLLLSAVTPHLAFTQFCHVPCCPWVIISVLPYV